MVNADGKFYTAGSGFWGMAGVTSALVLASKFYPFFSKF